MSREWEYPRLARFTEGRSLPLFDPNDIEWGRGRDEGRVAFSFPIKGATAASPDGRIPPCSEYGRGGKPEGEYDIYQDRTGQLV